MEIKINNTKYQAREGETILDVCRRENISIPTLCTHIKLPREAVCRLCLVEINLTDKLVPSCAFQVCEKLEVTTESEKIKKAREINMELLWSDHAGKCAGCKKNLKCALQNMAEEYKIENFHFVPRKENITDSEERDLLKDNKQRVVIDDKNPVIFRTSEYCVECRRCINICPVKSYGFNNRAGDTVVGTPYNKTLDCIFCGACVKHCPTAALADQNDLEEIKSKLADINKLSVAIIDPAILESLENEFDKKINMEKLAGILKKLGFEKVFNLEWGLEQYLSKFSQHFEDKKNNHPVFNSHCPSFSLYIKKYYPELEKYIAKIEIPDEIMAKHLKTEYARKEKIDPAKIVVFSISSCMAKKARKYKNLDYVLTVRELGRIAREMEIKPEEIKDFESDNLYSSEIKSGKNIIISGGLTYSLLVRKDKSSMNAVAMNNMEDIKKILDNVKSKKERYDFVEGMICPGGCGHGGGQSIGIK
jgi:iron only hydrogenase large subunit-like protein